MADDSAATLQTFHLTELSELRIEVSATQSVQLKLVSGSAEVFGAELRVGQTYVLTDQNVPVFTWKGCEVSVEGTAYMYTSEETPMTTYLNIHDILQKRRLTAHNDGGWGPRVMVVGPTDVGKSSLCRTLLNWAVRSGAKPLFADFDIGQGAIGVPGSLGATLMEVPFDIEEGLVSEQPLVYFYGLTSPSDKPELYKFEVDRMAHVLERLGTQDGTVRADGLVANTMGWVDGLGYELLQHTIAALKADIILVVGHDRLYSQLSEAFQKQKDIVVEKVPSSGGVAQRSPATRKQLRQSRLRRYFFGAHGEYHPPSFKAKFDDLKIFRIGGGPRAPSSALPIGSAPLQNPLRVTQMPVSGELLHSVLAVSHAATADEIPVTNVAGFIWVSDVDMTAGELTYLCPAPQPLVKAAILVAGDIRENLDA